MAKQGIQARTTAAAVAASRRLTALAIQAFQVSPERAPLPPVGRLELAVGPR